MIALLIDEMEVRRILLEFPGSSAVLSLLVEFVAGGEGRPDVVEGLLPRLGGSGRSGRLEEELLELVLRLPRKIADKGRLLCVKEGRGGIGTSGT